MHPAAGSAAQRLATAGGIGRVPLAPGTAVALQANVSVPSTLRRMDTASPV